MHHPASILPLGLLDWTLVRARTQLHATSSHTAYQKCTSTSFFKMHARRMHQAVAFAPQPASSSPAEDSDALYTRKNVRRKHMEKSLAVRKPSQVLRAGHEKTISELEKRVQVLESIPLEEASRPELPGFSEEKLLHIYEDLLAIPLTESIQAHSQAVSLQHQDRSMVLAIDERLAEADEQLKRGNALSNDRQLWLKLNSQRRVTMSDLSSAHLQESYSSVRAASLDPSAPPYQKIINRLQAIVEQLISVRKLVSGSSGEEDLSKDGVTIPVVVLSSVEWQALVRVCIHEHDASAAESTLDLMKRLNLPLAEELVNMVLGIYADRGDVENIERYMSHVLDGSPTERQRDLHIKAHLRASQPHSIPSSALSVLHKYEGQSTPAPIQTYTRVITALLSVRSTIGHAQAWDLFSHMRYVAHPTPDAVLYTLMIRACASSLTAPSEPERALDLWTEMTVDHQIKPTVGTYRALILACARSGTRAYVHEAFRLAKEMVELHRDASGKSAYKPDKGIFSALLEGAKRLGDLHRTRWILAELVKDDGSDQVDARKNDQLFVDEEIMVHAFHAYAAYKPPFRRANTVIVDSTDNKSANVAAEQPQIEPVIDSNTRDSSASINDAHLPSFSHIPPQTHGEVISETQALFSRIKEDTQQPNLVDSFLYDADPLHGKFSGVQITTRLLTSYLSVHYAHSSLEQARQLFQDIFLEFNVPKSPRALVEALERCAISKKGYERHVATSFANEVWREWQVMESEKKVSEVGARMVERAYAALMRVRTLTRDVDRALELVKVFVQRYPPASLTSIGPKPSMRSTRTILDAPRPLVRMTSTVDVPDDAVPPVLTFTDLENLHHGLVAARRYNDVAYLKYICKAYEGALRRRRDNTMKAVPDKDDT